jgi:hypothetical protein
MEIMWMLADHAPHAVLEANFRPKSEYERAKILGLGAQIVEVYCDCGADEASRRFAERASRTTHDRSAHPLNALTSELLAEYDRPVGVGKLLRVDTRDIVDIVKLARSVKDVLANQGS